MFDPDLDHDIRLGCRLADAARAATLPHFRSNLAVDNKLDKGFDPVTVADKASELAMREILEAEVPEDGILGEEFGERASSNGRRWVLDPIDGTRAFISGLPSWTVLIACAQDERPVVGVIDQPFIGERFIGWGKGACWQRGSVTRPLTVSGTTCLGNAILSTTDPYLFADAEAECFGRVREQARLTRFGYDAYAYAMLATGGMDLVIETDLQPYDIQALIPVVEGAGGIVTSWTGGPAWQGGQVIAAATRDLHEEAVALLAPAAA